jgi:hypothetical protein
MSVPLTDPSPAPPPEEEVTLFTLYKWDHVVEGKIRLLPHGAELRIVVNGALQRSQLFGDHALDEEALDIAAERTKRAWMARGWSAHAPSRS